MAPRKGQKKMIKFFKVTLGIVLILFIIVWFIASVINIFHPSYSDGKAFLIAVKFLITSILSIGVLAGIVWLIVKCFSD